MNQLSQTQQTFLAISKTQDAVLMLDGKPVMVPLRVPVQGEHVIIDALNCVMSVNTFTT